jgi:hypothetical protein
MKVTLKSTIGVLKMDGREYGPGDTVEMSESEASKIAHYLEEDLSAKGNREHIGKHSDKKWPEK